MRNKKNKIIIGTTIFILVVIIGVLSVMLYNESNSCVEEEIKLPEERAMEDLEELRERFSRSGNEPKEAQIINNLTEATYQGNLILKINNSKITQSYDYFRKSNKAELGQYIIVDIDVHNISNTIVYPISSDFKLVDNDGREYVEDMKASMTLKKKNQTYWSDRFNPGVKGSIRMVFDVPEGSLDKYKLQVQYDDGIGRMNLS